MSMVGFVVAYGRVTPQSNPDCHPTFKDLRACLSFYFVGLFSVVSIPSLTNVRESLESVTPATETRYAAS